MKSTPSVPVTPVTTPRIMGSTRAGEVPQRVLESHDDHKYTEAEILEHRPSWADLDKSDIAVGEAEDSFESNAVWVSRFAIKTETHSVGIDQVDIFGNGKTSAGQPVISLSVGTGDISITDTAVARNVAMALLLAASEIDHINGDQFEGAIKAVESEAV